MCVCSLRSMDIQVQDRDPIWEKHVVYDVCVCSLRSMDIQVQDRDPIWEKHVVYDYSHFSTDKIDTRFYYIEFITTR